MIPATAQPPVTRPQHCCGRVTGDCAVAGTMVLLVLVLLVIVQQQPLQALLFQTSRRVSNRVKLRPVQGSKQPISPCFYKK